MAESSAPIYLNPHRKYHQINKLNSRGDEVKNYSNTGAVPIQHQHPSTGTIQFDSEVAYSSRDNQALNDWKDCIRNSRDETKARKHCFCFQTPRGCVVTLVAFLLLLGVAIFFLFPRIPDIVIGEPFVNNQNSLRFNVSGPAGNTITAMSYDIAINFTVKSRNYFDFYTSEIVSTGNLLNQKNQLINNTYGYGKAEGLNFKALQSTTYSIPLTLYWFSVGLRANEDPALVEIQRCTLATPPQNFHIAYRVRVSLPLVSWTGWSLKTSGTVLFNISTATREQRKLINLVVETIISAVNVN